jgi:fumarate reductase flavoprotein subunit
MGLRIDGEARVHGRDDRPIPGLFAAGESAGGVLGDRIFGGGSSMSKRAGLRPHRRPQRRRSANIHIR